MDLITQTHCANDSSTSAVKLKSYLNQIELYLYTLALSAQLEVSDAMQTTDTYKQSRPLLDRHGKLRLRQVALPSLQCSLFSLPLDAAFITALNPISLLQRGRS
jgi:hypothetical protein